MNGCFVFVTSCRYAPEHDAVLLDVLVSQPELCAFAGVDCVSWKDAADWLTVVRDAIAEGNGAAPTITAHSGESLPEVIAFVDQWCGMQARPHGFHIVEIATHRSYCVPAKD